MPEIWAAHNIEDILIKSTEFYSFWSNANSSPVRKWNFRSMFYVVVDAIGLEMDYALETNWKEWKKNYWRELKAPEFHLSNFKFLTIMNSEMEEKHVF